MPKFSLVNPSLKGEIKTTFVTDTAKDAAESFWKNLSNLEIMLGSMPVFYCSFKDEQNELHHFLIMEKISEEDKTVNFEIEEVHIDMSEDAKNKLLELSEKVGDKFVEKQTGGKHHRRRYKYDDDDSSSSSSDSDDELDNVFRHVRRMNMRKPIFYWWYSPLVYKTVNTTGHTVIPAFKDPYSPFYHIYSS